MGKNTKIEWAHHTFNPWIGCTRVGPGCDHCYAEALAKRTGMAEWGSGKPRKLTSTNNWKQPNIWNREAKVKNTRYRVFCASLADLFDNEAPQTWRSWLFKLIQDTPHLDWIIITKRIGNVTEMLPADWGMGYPNVWLMATICNQDEASRDIPKLLKTPAAIHGISAEPLLGPLEITHWTKRWQEPHSGGGWTSHETILDWVIVGGESGPGARHMQPSWAEVIAEECNATHTPFFFKQWGGQNKRSDGRTLNGREYSEFPSSY